MKERFAVLLGGRACDPTNCDAGVLSVKIVLRGLDKTQDIRSGFGLGLREAVKGENAAVTDRGGVLFELRKNGTNPVLALETRSDRKGDDLEGVADAFTDGVAVREFVGKRAAVPMKHVDTILSLRRRGNKQHLRRGIFFFGKHEITDPVLHDMVGFVKDHEIDFKVLEEMKTMIGDDDDLGTDIRFDEIQDGVGIGGAVATNDERVHRIHMIFPGRVFQIVFAELIDEGQTGKDHDIEGKAFFEQIGKKDTGLSGAAPHFKQTLVIFLQGFTDAEDRFLLVGTELHSVFLVGNC